MSTNTRVSHPIYSLGPTDVEGFDSLAALALRPPFGWPIAGNDLSRIVPHGAGVAVPLEATPILWQR